MIYRFPEFQSLLCRGTKKSSFPISGGRTILILVLLLIPLSVFVGICASAIGMTAWPLIVPLLFVFSGFNIYLTLFISLLMDCGNALVMMRVAGQRKLMDIKLGVRLALFALLWIAAGIFVGTFFIPENEEMFRGAAGL